MLYRCGTRGNVPWLSLSKFDDDDDDDDILHPPIPMSLLYYIACHTLCLCGLKTTHCPFRPTKLFG